MYGVYIYCFSSGTASAEEIQYIEFFVTIFVLVNVSLVLNVVGSPHKISTIIVIGSDKHKLLCNVCNLDDVGPKKKCF